MDDYLPLKHGKIFLTTSDETNEFWPALLEKAYAKIHGCYLALDGGFEEDAFLDFTGTCIEYLSGEEDLAPKKIFKTLHKADQLRALMSCSFKNDQNGLISGHAYSITKVILLRHEGEKMFGPFRPFSTFCGFCGFGPFLSFLSYWAFFASFCLFAIFSVFSEVILGILFLHKVGKVHIFRGDS